MKARMEKYVTTSEKSRTSKNEKLYDEVQDMNIDYINIDVNNALELNPSKNHRSSREDFQKQRELNKILPRNEEKQRIIDEEVEPKENRIYDINEILKLARENKLFEDKDKKRLINTEYNILTKLDIENLESEEMKKEDLKSLINDIYQKEEPVKRKSYSRKEEEALLNDLFEDCNEEKEVKEELELKEELSKQILDKHEETDEEITIDDNEETVIEENIKEIENVEQMEMSEDYIEIKEGKGLMIAIIVVTILILLTIGFFVYEYFFGI